MIAWLAWFGPSLDLLLQRGVSPLGLASSASVAFPQKLVSRPDDPAIFLDDERVYESRVFSQPTNLLNGSIIGRMASHCTETL
jgi:hypothetical protein